MNGLSARHRFTFFLSTAVPALSAFLLGRLLANSAAIVQRHLEAGIAGTSPTAYTRGFFAFLHFLEAHHLSVARLGGFAAIAIATSGFVITRRLPWDQASRAILWLVLIAWTVQVSLLMASLIAFASPLASHHP